MACQALRGGHGLSPREGRCGIYRTAGRWVGLDFDGRIMSGWESMGPGPRRIGEDHGRADRSEASPTSMTELCEVVITAPEPGWLKDFSRKLIEQRLCAN